MHHQLSVLPLPAGAANIEGMDVTIVAPDARRAATFAATAATLLPGLVPHCLCWFWCHTSGPSFVPHSWPCLCDTLHATLCAILMTDLERLPHILRQQTGGIIVVFRSGQGSLHLVCFSVYVCECVYVCLYVHCTFSSIMQAAVLFSSSLLSVSKQQETAAGCI